MISQENSMMLNKENNAFANSLVLCPLTMRSVLRAGSKVLDSPKPSMYFLVVVWSSLAESSLPSALRV